MAHADETTLQKLLSELFLTESESELEVAHSHAQSQVQMLGFNRMATARHRLILRIEQGFGTTILFKRADGLRAPLCRTIEFFGQ
jgi:hypothetical protein